MNPNNLVVEITISVAPGPVRAHADVRIELSEGSLTIYGFSVIQKDGKPPWVGFPQKQGKIPGKYFPVVEADGEFRKKIANAVMAAYDTAKTA